MLDHLTIISLKLKKQSDAKLNKVDIFKLQKKLRFHRFLNAFRVTQQQKGRKTLSKIESKRDEDRVIIVQFFQVSISLV
jgi:hypothetical protein